jgi:hypothetical protein
MKEFTGRADQVAANILHGVDDGQIVIGPVVTHPKFALPYFIVAGHDKTGFRLDQVMLKNPDDYHRLVAMIADQRGLVINLMEDELTMARLCRALWPCKKTERILAQIEADYQTKH